MLVRGLAELLDRRPAWNGSKMMAYSGPGQNVEVLGFNTSTILSEDTKDAIPFSSVQILTSYLLLWLPCAGGQYTHHSHPHDCSYFYHCVQNERVSR